MTVIEEWGFVKALAQFYRGGPMTPENTEDRLRQFIATFQRESRFPSPEERNELIRRAWCRPTPEAFQYLLMLQEHLEEAAGPQPIIVESAP